MLYFIIIMLTSALTVLVITIVSTAKKTKMPNPFKKKEEGKNEMGFLSDKWVDWLEKNFSEQSGPLPIYDHVIPKKIQQKRYARTHKADFHEIINDVLYDTDIAKEFFVQETMFMNNEPCAKHYYATTDHKTFFYITSRLHHKDECSSMTLKEVKKLLGKDPEKYSKFIPGAAQNEDIQQYIELKRKREQEEEEAKREEAEKQKKEKEAISEKENEKGKNKKEKVKNKEEKVKTENEKQNAGEEKAKTIEISNKKNEINENKQENSEENKGSTVNGEGKNIRNEDSLVKKDDENTDERIRVTSISDNSEIKEKSKIDEAQEAEDNIYKNEPGTLEDPMCASSKNHKRKKLQGSAFEDNAGGNEIDDIEDDFSDMEAPNEPEQDDRIDKEDQKKLESLDAVAKNMPKKQ